MSSPYLDRPLRSLAECESQRQAAPATSNIERHNDEADADASAWARVLGMGGWMFKSLQPGDRFVFQKEDADKPHCILVKTTHGYRHEVGGRQWKTGARTACFKLPAAKAEGR